MRVSRTQDPTDARIAEPADRVEALRELLLACRDGGRIVVRLQLPRERWAASAPFSTGSRVQLEDTVHIDVELAPSGWVHAVARVQIFSNSPFRITSALNDVGWYDVVGGSQHDFDLDPDDPTAVGVMVDAITAAYAACGMTEDPAWQVERITRGVGAGAAEDPWVDDIGPNELREAIRRMAVLRGGLLQVRRSVGPSPTIDLTVRRARGAIEVSPAQRGAATGVRLVLGTVRLDPAFLDVGSLFENLEAALASKTEPGVAPALSLRENLTEVRSWDGASGGEGYLVILLWIPTFLILAASGANAGWERIDGIYWCGLGMVAFAPWAATLRVGDRLGWRISTVRKAGLGVLAVAAVTLGLLPILLPTVWRTVGAAVWATLGIAVAFAIIRSLARRILRRLRS